MRECDGAQATPKIELVHPGKPRSWPVKEDHMKMTRSTISTAVTIVAMLILVAAIPSAVRDTLETGRVYLFSRQFLDELPQRFTGPGRIRFVLQPLIAILLGCRSGLDDARAGRAAYLYGLILGGEDRNVMLRSGLTVVRDLIAIGIVLDAVAQLLIYGQVHPGAAAVIGPVLICIPYALARALTNRLARLARRHANK
jgi:hypothetical protein